MVSAVPLRERGPVFFATQWFPASRRDQGDAVEDIRVYHETISGFDPDSGEPRSIRRYYIVIIPTSGGKVDRRFIAPGEWIVSDEAGVILDVYTTEELRRRYTNAVE